MAIKYPNDRSVCVRDIGITANKRRRRKLIIFKSITSSITKTARIEEDLKTVSSNPK